MNDAYVSNVLNSIHNIVDNNSNHILFSASDFDILQRLLAADDQSLAVLSRLEKRVGPYFHVGSIASYIRDETQLYDIVINMHKQLYIEILGYDDDTALCSVDLIIDAINSTFNNEQLYSFCKKHNIIITGLKRPGILSKMKSYFTNQRTVFGKPISHTKLINGFLSDLKNDKEYKNINLVRINPSVLLLMRRAQRLHEISSSYTYTGCSTRVAISPNISSVMMSLFNKIKFPSYNIASLPSLFNDHDSFLFWEYACELRFIFEEITVSPTYDKTKIPHIARIVSLYPHRSCYNTEIILKNLGSVIDTWSASDATDIRQQSLVIVSVISVLCFLCYCCGKKTSDQGNGKINLLLDAGTILAACSNLAALNFEKYNSKYSKSSEAITMNYNISIFVFVLLLSHPFLPHRRGRWYLRIAIDMEHLHKNDEAFAVIRQGLSDASVTLASRLPLIKKFNKGCNSKQKREEFCYDTDYNPSDTLYRLLEQYVDSLVSQYCVKTAPTATKDSHATKSSTFSSTSHWNCSMCTFLNSPYIGACEMCETSRIAPISITESIVEVAEQEIPQTESVQYSFVFSADAGVEPAAVKMVDHDMNLLFASIYDDKIENESICLDIAAINAPKTLEISGFRLTTKLDKRPRFFTQSNDFLTVEDYVLSVIKMTEMTDESGEFIDAMQGGGWSGWHCEGSLIRSIFGLLMYDIVFADDVEGAFYSRYQSCPLDLYDSSFYSNRKQKIQAHLQYIDTCTSEELIDFIGNMYQAHMGEQALNINWRHPLRTLQLVALCIGGRGLSYICKAMCVNYKAFGAGMPDLLCVRVKNAVTRELVSIADILGAEWQSWRATSTDAAPKDSSGADDIIGFSSNKRVKYNEDEEVEVEESMTEHTASDSVDPETESIEYLHYDPNLVYEVVLVEVKGPGDVLSDRQLLWLHLFTMANINNYVIKVKEKRDADSV